MNQKILKQINDINNDIQKLYEDKNLLVEQVALYNAKICQAMLKLVDLNKEILLSKNKKNDNR